MIGGVVPLGDVASDHAPLFVILFAVDAVQSEVTQRSADRAGPIAPALWISPLAIHSTSRSILRSSKPRAPTSSVHKHARVWSPTPPLCPSQEITGHTLCPAACSAAPLASSAASQHRTPLYFHHSTRGDEPPCPPVRLARHRARTTRAGAHDTAATARRRLQKRPQFRGARLTPAARLGPSAGNCTTCLTGYSTGICCR